MKNIILVKDIMREDYTSIPQDATIREAAEILHQGGFSGAPVVDKEGKLIGIISEKDLFQALYPSYGEFYEQEETIPTMGLQELQHWLKDAGSKPIKEFIKKPITTTPDTALVKIGALMLAKGIHRLPVLENEKLVGIISRRRLYRAIFNHIFEFGEKK